MLPAVLYLIEVFEVRTGDGPAPTLAASTSPVPMSDARQLTVGGVVRHDTYGEGQLKGLTGVGDKQVAEVDFGAEAGAKRLLVRYANLVHVR